MNKLFAYPGGKWPIRHLVVSAFPGHKTYVDVFGGSAAILLTKEPSDAETTRDDISERCIAHQLEEKSIE